MTRSTSASSAGGAHHEGCVVIHRGNIYCVTCLAEVEDSPLRGEAKVESGGSAAGATEESSGSAAGAWSCSPPDDHYESDSSCACSMCCGRGQWACDRSEISLFCSRCGALEEDCVCSECSARSFK